MINPIPPLLFRGDSDTKNIRDLKNTLHYQQLQTNLLKGGIGHEIFTTPILQLVGQHIDPGWAQSHFLSFSEDITTALRFGLNCDYNQVEERLCNFIPYYEDRCDWTFAIITIDTTRIRWRTVSQGIQQGFYEPSLRKFQMYPGYAKIILIDVVTAINNYPSHPNYDKILSNAVRDKEWLLLPASEMQMNTGAVEYSGIMDGSCISEIVKYKVLSPT
jgi:hypothetical protein